MASPCSFFSFLPLPAIAATFLLASTAGMHAQTAPVVQIQSGKVKGVSADGIESFRGIPYAAPPVGPLRWRPPQPAAPWKDVKSAENFGPACMQTRVPFTPALSDFSEDCLSINVWRPAKPAKKTPVMVWIHGGGFFNGTSGTALYDGKPFAKQGVIFVTMNYRIGRFGFFAHPALTKENPQGPLGNYGFMDQIASLQWVKNNIAAFGGDPNNITIFGESAGARSVESMLIAPMAKGLFQKAIIESGTQAMQDATPMAAAESIGVEFAKVAKLENPDAAALRALPAETIVGGLQQGGDTQGKTFPGPIVDGKLMTDNYTRSFAKGAFNKVPLIIGTNDYEAKVFVRAINYPALLERLGPRKDALFKTYEAMYPDETDRASRFMTEMVYFETSRAIARSFVKAGQRAYFYRFSYRAEALRGKVLGALHASELPFVFDNLAQTPATAMSKVWNETLFDAPLAFTDKDRAMAKAINGYWIDFARTGNPNGGGRAKWTPVSQDKDALLDFTADGPKGGKDPAAARLDILEEANAPLRK